MQKWKKISSKILFDDPRLRLLEDQVELPSGKKINYIRYGNHKSAAMVFALDDDKVLVQHEYSYPPDRIMLQLPGGAVENGESPEAAANRELIEESGYTAGKLELLGSYYMNNRRSAAKMYVYLGTEMTACEKVGGDEEEFIESFWVPLESIPKNIANGKIDNFSILVAWAFFEAKHRA